VFGDLLDPIEKRRAQVLRQPLNEVSMLLDDLRGRRQRRPGRFERGEQLFLGV
jgi:hypothetical protein